MSRGMFCSGTPGAASAAAAAAAAGRSASAAAAAANSAGATGELESLSQCIEQNPASAQSNTALLILLVLDAALAGCPGSAQEPQASSVSPNFLSQPDAPLINS